MFADLSSIDSTTDSQAGGDYFPPVSSENANGGDSPRRANLTLNFSALPPNLPLGAGVSPASMVSSAPFTTDHMSLALDPTAEDYFHFADPSMSASTKALADQANATAQQHVAAVTAAAAAAVGVQPQQLPQPSVLPPTPLTAPSSNGSFTSAAALRLPASQPSSPVRGVFISGQQSFAMASAGRQRGATVSGLEFSNGMAGPASAPLVAPVPASAVPAHLSFSTISSPASTPSAVVSTPAAAAVAAAVAAAGATPGTSDQRPMFLGEPQQQQQQQGGDVSMEDASQNTPQGSQLSRCSSTSQQSAVAAAVGATPVVASTVASQPATTNQSGATTSASATVPPSRQPSNDTRDVVERLTLERLTMLDT